MWYIGVYIYIYTYIWYTGCYAITAYWEYLISGSTTSKCILNTLNAGGIKLALFSAPNLEIVGNCTFFF